MKPTARPRRDKAEPTAWMTTRTVNLIRRIHRKDDAYVGFYRKSESEPGMPCIAGIRAGSMREQFPSIAPEVIDQENVYITVNGYWPGERNEGKESVSYLGRNERFLRSLNACYVDLDVSRLPLLEKPDQPEAWQDWVDAKHVVERMAENGEIPHPSIYARSGRGLYVYWLLHDEENPENPVPFYMGDHAKLDLYKRINAAIQGRLKAVAPDPAAKDGARVLRAPNSLHRNGVTVKYQVNYDENDTPPSYTLGELAERFEVGEVKPQRKRYVPKNKVPKRKNGWLEVNRKRARDLERFAAAKGIQHGRRRKTLRVYSWALRGSGIHPREAAEKMRQMANQCIPAYPSEDNDTPTEAIVSDTYSKTPLESGKALELKHEYVCNTVGITAEIAEELNLETIVPDTVKQEREEMRRNAPTRAEERRAWIVADADRLAAILAGNASLRELAEAATKSGHKCSHETIRKDLEVIRHTPPFPAGLN